MNHLESTAPFGTDQIGMSPDQSRWIEMLQDRTLVAIRPMTERDAGAERTLTEALVPRLRRLRFKGQLVCPFMTLARQFDEIDQDLIGQDRSLAFAAFIPDGLNESILGISTYSTNSDESSCTCDVAVLDEWHCRGLGSLLMRHLIEIARRKGIDYMFGADSAQNAPMIELAKRLGFSQQIDPRDRSQVLHGLWL